MTSFMLCLGVFIFIGAFAGIMAGILGIGGGIIVVPGLAFIFRYAGLIPEDAIMHVAAGSSLAAMILTSQSSLRAHLRMGEILWPIFYKLWPGIVLGVIAGVCLAKMIPTHWLELIFGIFLLLVAVKMMLDKKSIHAERFPPEWVNRLISFIIGLKSGMLGVGGGVLIIPYLTYCGVAIRKIAAVSNLCTLTVATLGTLLFILTGWDEMKTVPFALGFVYWPAVIGVAIPSMVFAPLGVKLNYILPTRYLKWVFLVILLITAFHMLY